MTLNFEPSVAETLLRHMYQFDYDDKADLGNEDALSPLVFNVHMLIAADFCDMPPLAKLAVAEFKKRAESEWESAAFADAILTTYISAPDNDYGLRRHILSVAGKHSEKLFSEDCGKRFREVVASLAPFAMELGKLLAKLLATERGEPKGSHGSRAVAMVKCANCTMVFGLLRSQPKIHEHYGCPHCGWTATGVHWLTSRLSPNHNG